MVRATPNSLAAYQGLETWLPDSADPTLFRRASPSVVVLTGPATSAIEALPEWDAALRALHDDSVLGRVVDRLVGTAVGAGLVQAESLLRSVVERSVVADKPEDVLDAWRIELGGDTVVVTTLVALGGVEPREPLGLREGVTVRRMTDAEVGQMLSYGMLPVMPLLGPVAFVHQRACIALDQVVPRVVLGGEETGTEGRLADAIAFNARRDESVEAALATLQLLGLRHARELGRVTFAGQGITQFGARATPPVPGPSDVVEPTVEPRARALHAVVSAAIARPRLAIALRRFSGSHQPRHEQDRLLDLWISMEAIFGPADGTEVTYRLALNTANTVAVPGLTRRELFDWVRVAYKLRSRLVHGRRPTAIARLHGGTTDSIDDAADDVREVLSVALNLLVFEESDPDFTELALRG